MLLLSHSCDIYRNQAIGTNGRRGLQKLYSAVDTLAIPMDAKTSIQNGFELGRGYDFFFDSSQDVKVGDKLTWSGDDYTVSAVQRYATPLADHTHVLAKQEVN